MKKIIFLSFAILSFLFTSCDYDNYDAPSLLLHGKLTYNGDNFLYDGNPDRWLLRVYQTGFGKVDGGTNLRVDENGEYQQLLFADDNYKLTPDNRQYPFEFKDFKPRAVGYDSLTVKLRSNLEMNFEVTPYFTVNNFKTTLEGTDIVMRFSIAKVSGTDKPTPKAIRALCYVNTAALVNSKTTAVEAQAISITDQGNIEMRMPVSTYRSKYVNNYRTYAFCRVAVELENIPDFYLFSETQKIEGLPQ